MKRLPPTTDRGAQIATLRAVNEYLTELIHRELPMRPLPPALAAQLLVDVLREVHELLGSGEVH